MATRDDYTVGWICALPLEMAAAKATLDQIFPDLPSDPGTNDTNAYILGSLNGHNVVVACLPAGVYGNTSATTVILQMLASFKSIRLNLMVGVGGGVPYTKEDVRLGDIVVSRPAASRPGIIQYDLGKKLARDQFISTGALNKPSTLLLTAAGKVETNAILGESQISEHIEKIVEKDPFVFSHPGPQQDVLFESDYEHSIRSIDNTCSHCDPTKMRHRRPRETLKPRVHYGLIASGNQVMRDGVARDKLANEYGILCFEMEAAGLMDIGQCLVIRGICDYADSHKAKRWQGYAAAAAAAYAKELLSLIPRIPRPEPLVSVTDSIVSAVLDALLLTRPEVDRSSLIALKGRRVRGTCEWITQHPSFEQWLKSAESSVLWVSGGPGKGKTMLSIYITEELQPVIDSSQGLLLYYFCSNRDKSRNSALTLMRGVLYQWLSLRPQLAKHIWSYFDGVETTKYTLSNFVCLWRLFMTLLRRDRSSQVVLLVDGLDECEEDSLRQFLDSLNEYMVDIKGQPATHLKAIILSRPQPGPLQSVLRPSRQIILDESGLEIGKDVERYISAKISELATEQILSVDQLEQVRQFLMAHADGTFLWVGFVANELKGRSWLKANDILRSIPNGLVGVYRRLVEQVEDKERLIPILQWIVLAARPMTVNELAVAAGVKAYGDLTAVEILKDQLTSCGMLVKIDGEVVNLVHESAREFFQSKEVKYDGIDIFHMNHTTHRRLMRTCLELIESSYNSSGRSISEESLHNTLLTYASIYWPEHFKNAFDPVESRTDTSRQFFQAESAVREDWWRFYWQREKAGGSAPSFTLLHLSAYFGNLAWANMLLEQNGSNGVPFRHYASRKDSYGRTPLFWAATRGHHDVVALLIKKGARINSKDRSKMTALHAAISGEHKSVVSLLLNESAHIEAKDYYGETPLMRAIQADSREIITMLLKKGARVDGLPTPPGFATLKSDKGSEEECAKQLLGLQEQLFSARYENQSKLVAATLRILTFSVRFRPIFKFVSLYVRHWSLGRWEVLQDLVKNNETARLREWAQSFASFGNQLVESRDPKRLAAMTELSVQVFQVVSNADLEALLVIGVLVGSAVMQTAARCGWRKGVEISGRTFSRFASLAHQSGAEESLDYGVRQFLIDFDGCVRCGRRAESVDRVVVLFSTHLAILAKGDPWPIEYFSTVIREFCEGYIGGIYEEQLFHDVSQACANELATVSESKDYRRLSLVLSALTQIAHSTKEKGQDWFLNVQPASCRTLCENDATSHRWLIGEAIPEAMSVLISQQKDAQFRKKGFKALVECLIIGKGYGLPLPAAVRKTVRQNLGPFDGVDGMLDEVLSS